MCIITRTNVASIVLPVWFCTNERTNEWTTCASVSIYMYERALPACREIDRQISCVDRETDRHTRWELTSLLRIVSTTYLCLVLDWTNISSSSYRRPFVPDLQHCSANKHVNIDLDLDAYFILHTKLKEPRWITASHPVGLSLDMNYLFTHPSIHLPIQEAPTDSSLPLFQLQSYSSSFRSSF